MIIGTAGHIDHGKTALVRALTGVDTDRLREEKARGITIDLGFAYLPVPAGGTMGFVDVPGHEKFVHNMLAGATGIDFVLLAIAADDGVMPQTREHLAIVDLLGLTRGIVVMTKVDLADAVRRSEVAAEIGHALAGTGLAGADILPVSAVTGEGIEALRARLLVEQTEVRARRDDAGLRLAVDRSFTLQGAGTVVTGLVLSGAVKVGDQITISPAGLRARVRALHAQNRPAQQGHAGERCALNLAGDGIAKDAIHRGDIVLDPALHAPTVRIDGTLRVLASEVRPIGQWTPVRLHHAAAEVGARIVLLGDAPIAPGSEALVQLVLDKPIAAASGDRYVLRDVSAQRTIGGGRFIDLRAPARKRRTQERLMQLQALALDDPQAALSALLDIPPFHADLGVFARDRAVPFMEAEHIADRLGLQRVAIPGATVVLSRARSEALKQAIVETLRTFHVDNPDLAGMALERLRLAVAPWLPAPVFRAVLQVFGRNGDVGLDGAWIHLPGHEVRLTDTDERLWLRIAPLLGGEHRFRPPRVRDIRDHLDVAEDDVRRLLKLVGRLSKVDEVAHDHFFLRATVAEMVAMMVDLAGAAPDGQFGAAQFRDQVNNGRKVAIQILEFFDRHGVTLRRGDQRRINRHRLDLFCILAGKGTAAPQSEQGREASPVGRPDFKSGRGRETVPGGFDSHSLPPTPGVTAGGARP